MNFHAFIASSASSRVWFAGHKVDKSQARELSVEQSPIRSHNRARMKSRKNFQSIFVPSSLGGFDKFTLSFQFSAVCEKSSSEFIWCFLFCLHFEWEKSSEIRFCVLIFLFLFLPNHGKSSSSEIENSSEKSLKIVIKKSHIHSWLWRERKGEDDKSQKNNRIRKKPKQRKKNCKRKEKLWKN